MTLHHYGVVLMFRYSLNVLVNLTQLVGVSVESAAVHDTPNGYSFIMIRVENTTNGRNGALRAISTLCATACTYVTTPYYLCTVPIMIGFMASAKTRDFEVFETIVANNAGNTQTIDLNTFVNVAEMEAFGIESVTIGIDATETAPATAEFMAQLALEDLSGGFISHASYDSLYLVVADATTGFTEQSLSLGDVKQVRYVPGGQLQVRADRMGGSSDVNLYIRITGKISKLSAADYMSLALTNSLSN